MSRCNYLYPENSNESIALAELVAYIEETRAENIDDFAFFKLADLAKLYKTRLEQLGVYVPERFNSTRLKERILQQCPALHDSKKGRDVILAFEDDIGTAIHYANENSRDSQATYLAKDNKKRSSQQKTKLQWSFLPVLPRRGCPRYVASPYQHDHRWTQHQ